VTRLGRQDFWKSTISDAETEDFWKSILPNAETEDFSTSTKSRSRNLASKV
jgi:hypothetical protein